MPFGGLLGGYLGPLTRILTIESNVGSEVTDPSLALWMIQAGLGGCSGDDNHLVPKPPTLTTWSHDDLVTCRLGLSHISQSAAEDADHSLGVSDLQIEYL